jgi:hypothetical protein
MNQPTDLHADGYVLLKNALSQDDVKFALSCQRSDNKINYVKMRRFIDTKFFPGIERNLDAISAPHYVKFRFSNNNNANDAAMFHGDIYNHSGDPMLPIFTCLCYFDDAQMELIPKSHLQNSTPSTFRAFERRVQLKLAPGDVLVFHANLHHRGINYYKTENRRILQVFDVFPNAATYERHAPKLVIVETSKSTFVEKVVNPMMISMSDSTKLIDAFTLLHYLLVNNDLQYKVMPMDLEPWNKRGKYVSYEPARRVVFEELPEDGAEALNVNIVCDTKIHSRLGSNFYLYVYLAVAGVVFFAVYYYRNLDRPLAQRRGSTGRSRSRQLR